MERSTSRLQPRWIVRKMSPSSQSRVAVPNGISRIVNGQQNETVATVENRSKVKVKDTNGPQKEDRMETQPQQQPSNGPQTPNGVSVNGHADLHSSRMDAELYSRLKARRLMMEKLEAAAAVASNDPLRSKLTTTSYPSRPTPTTSPSISQLKRPRPTDARPRPQSSVIDDSTRCPMVTSSSSEEQNGETGPDSVINARHMTSMKLVLDRAVNDLREAKHQLREKNLAVEALAVLVQWMNNKQQQQQQQQTSSADKKLKQTTLKLAAAEHRLQKIELQNCEFRRRCDAVTSEMMSLSKRYESEVRRQNVLHQTTLQTAELRHSFDVETTKQEVIDRFTGEINDLKAKHQSTLCELIDRHKAEMEQVSEKHKKNIVRFEAEMNAKITELNRLHQKQIDDVTRRFEQTQQCLTERTAQLRRECEERRRREKLQEMERQRRPLSEACQFSSDPARNQQQEIDSLKAVVEMRNHEMNQLRSRNQEIEKQIEGMSLLRDANEKLQQKIENLEAIIDIKVDYERELAEKHRNLLRRFDAESRAMKRLSMDNEQLVWRLSQSSLDASCNNGTSPPSQIGSTPDMLRLSSMSRLPTSPTSSHVTSSPLMASPSSRRQYHQRPKSMVQLPQSSTVGGSGAGDCGTVKLRRPRPGSGTAEQSSMKNISAIRQSDV